MPSKWLTFLWPLKGIDAPGRTLREKAGFLIRRELSSHTTPLGAARSLGIGVFFGLTPLYCFQVISMLATSLIIPINRPLAFLGVCISIAPLLPFIILAAIVTGRFALHILGIPPESVAMNKYATYGIEWFIGSWIMAIIGGTLVFAVSYFMFKVWKR